MTGSDSDEARHVSQADLATFRQDVENEMAQLQAALHRAVNDLADTTRALAPVGGGGSNGGPGSQPGSPAAGVPRPGHGASSIALLCQPIDGGPVGAGAVGNPVPGATPSSSGTTGQPVAGVSDAYPGQRGLPTPDNRRPGPRRARPPVVRGMEARADQGKRRPPRRRADRWYRRTRG